MGMDAPKQCLNHRLYDRPKKGSLLLVRQDKDVRPSAEQLKRLAMARGFFLGCHGVVRAGQSMEEVHPILARS